MRSWIKVLTGRHADAAAAGSSTRKTIDVAVVKAEAETLVDQIRSNLRHLEGVVTRLPDPPESRDHAGA